MQNNLKTHIIAIAKILGVEEKEVFNIIYNEFENTSDKVDQILDETWEEFN